MNWSQIANLTASGLVTLCCARFAVVYHRHAPWRSTRVGRHLMTFTITIGGLCLYTVLVTIWPVGCAATVLRSARTLLLLFIAVLVIQRTHMVLAAQRRGAALIEAERHEQSPPA